MALAGASLPAAGFFTGYADAFTFGRTSQWQSSLYGSRIADYNRSGYAYTIGLGAGVVSQVAMGNWSSGVLSTTTAARSTYIGARAFQAYSVLGDAVGVYDSVGAFVLAILAPWTCWASPPPSASLLDG